MAAALKSQSLIARLYTKKEGFLQKRMLNYFDDSNKTRCLIFTKTACLVAPVKFESDQYREYARKQVRHECA